ncbi:hypothetical protein FEM48_Zijuj01G0196900 [Ziziphus jujuba var. spinosa]|uniref:Pentatricopeptide repeat-containing protein n=1 Tax=Ziziphus jujuba var. spinosa TaxID=714518 RepID=A0A978W368_ZIZJJ|nr:hypothetical protein FEM48_Zijuj01G0196900 [Ziziphus jujuba var. spinosa]
MIQNTVKNDNLISLSRNCKTLNQLKQIHAHLLISRIPQNPYAIAPLLSAAVTSGNASFFSYARSIFDRLLHRNTFMYNSMIRGYVQSRSPVAAFCCYLDMLDQGLAANNFTFPPLIKACAILVPNSRLTGRLVHAHVVKFGFLEDPFTISALIEFYSLVHDMETARLLFDRSPQKDVVVWTLADMGVADCGTHVLSYNMYREAGWEIEANSVRKMISDGGMKKKPGSSVIEVNGVVEEFLAGGLCHPQAQEIIKILDSFFKRVNLEDI